MENNALQPQVDVIAAFWDGLDRIPLTKRALRELNRRNHPIGTSRNAKSRSPWPTTIERFSRKGGPDLTDLRNVRNPYLPIQTVVMLNFDSFPIQRIGQRT